MEKQRNHLFSIKQGCTFLVHATIQVSGFVVRNSCLRHGGNCKPSPSQLVVDKWKSGGYTKFTEREWLEIIATIDSRAPVRILRNVLQRFLPRRIPLLAQHISSIRAREKEEPKRLKENISNAQTSSFIEGADNDIQDIVGSAENEARLQLRDTLATSPGWKLIHYLTNLKARDQGFDFRVAYDSASRTPTGVCWMTSTMRANLELYGDVLFLDDEQENFVDTLAIL
ncbi:MAG: hypothetical protein AAGM67_07390 [Bacteroidota bacterium]